MENNLFGKREAGQGNRMTQSLEIVHKRPFEMKQIRKGPIHRPHYVICADIVA